MKNSQYFQAEIKFNDIIQIFEFFFQYLFLKRWQINNYCNVHIEENVNVERKSDTKMLRKFYEDKISLSFFCCCEKKFLKQNQTLSIHDTIHQNSTHHKNFFAAINQST